MKVWQSSTLLIALLIAGCGQGNSSSPSPTTSPAGPETKASQPQDAPAVTPPKTTDVATNATVPTEPAKSTPAPVLPAELKNDAYEYYGLALEKPLNLQITLTAQPGNKLSGTTTTTLKEVKDGKAIFEQHRSGALGDMTVTLSLEKGGVYVTSISNGTTTPHSMELPAKLTPGLTFKDHSEMEGNGQSIKMDNDEKVVGLTKVKTKLGEYEAMLVTSTGKGTMNGVKMRMDTKSWYVKGRGAVKAEITQYPAGGKPQLTTLEEVP